MSDVYDYAGRVAFVVATRGDEEETVAMTYDGSGDLMSICAENGVAEFEYDSFLPTVEGSGGLWSTFDYDKDFRVAKKTYSCYMLNEDAPLAEIDIAYDDDGDVVRVGDLYMERNPATGFVESTALLGVVDGRRYNGYGECTNYVAAFGDADLYTASLKRDGLGRVVEREECVLSGDTVTSRYDYDLRGRLVSVTTNGSVAESYAYDANGNRLGGEYDAQDRQLAFGGAVYAYDLNGSMTNRNGVALTWNLFGRLVSVGGVSYLRDEQQRLHIKMADGEPEKVWMWSGSRLVAEYDFAADTASVFIYAGATAPAYMIRDGVTYRIITDNQGSVRLVVNAETGEVAQRLEYNSFGCVLCDTNPGFQPFGFQGGLYDHDTGLVEFGCRWYDAATGRWISKDPILLDGGWNVYAFCDNDSINRTDPSGLCEVFVNPSIIGPVFPLEPVQHDDGYWDRYFRITDSLMINPLPTLIGTPIVPIPKRWAPATGGRAPALGSKNEWTSLPRGLGADNIPGAKNCLRSSGFRNSSSAVGVAIWGVGVWNFGVAVGALIGAIF